MSIQPVSPNSVNRQRLRPLNRGWGILLGLMGSALVSAPAWGQSTVTTVTTEYEETFANGTLSPGNSSYIVGGTLDSVCLTASSQPTGYPQIGRCPTSSAALPGGVDPSGGGALRLTSNTLGLLTGGERGFFINNKTLGKPITNKTFTEELVIEFKFFTYNGKSSEATSVSGGDGLSFFLLDGAANPTEPGAFGGSLGYAQRSIPGQQPVAGLAGAYVGIGFDEFGNFSNSNEGRIGGSPPLVLTRNQVVVRGPAPAYGFIELASPGFPIDSVATATPFIAPGAPPADNGAPSRTDPRVTPRQVKITLTPTGFLTLQIYQPGQTNAIPKPSDYPPPILSVNVATLPNSFKFGFAASTGTSTAIHEVQNVRITKNTITNVFPTDQRLRLIKRVTAITRSGVRTDFTQVVDDPNDPNDTLPGWAQLTGGLVGVPIVGQADRLQTADDIEYTIYYLAEGNTTLLAPKICDAIPAKTTLVPNSLQISQNNSAFGAGGTAFSRLQPLPATASACTDQANGNGSVLFDLGNLPVTNSANSAALTTTNFVGAVRFKTRIN